MGELSVIDYDQHMAMREEYEKKLKEKDEELRILSRSHTKLVNEHIKKNF